jgi:membrane-bound serine protease (ClpP class)
MIAAAVAAFMNGILAGTLVLIGGLVVTPIAITATMKILPRTGLGKGIILDDGDMPGERAEGRLAASKAVDRRALIGRQARVLRDLHPSGLIELEGKRLDAVSEGRFIESGSTVEIVRISGRDIVVREVASPEQAGAEAEAMDNS